jgi:hypothetical protein
VSPSVRVLRAVIFLAAMIWSIGSQSATMEADKQAALEPVSSPDGKSSSPNFTNMASIQASTSDTKATLSAGGFIPSPTTAIDYLRVSLGGDAPVSKDSNSDTDIGSVSGLTAGASANTSISAFWWPHQPLSDTNDMKAICISEFNELIDGYTYGDLSASHVDPGCSATLFDLTKLKAIVKGFNKSRDDCAKYTLKNPAPTEINRAQDGSYPATAEDCGKLAGHPAAALATPIDDAHLKSVVAVLHRINGRTNSVKVLTLGATANRQKVSYFNKTDLSTLINDHSTGYGVNLTMSFIRPTYMLDGGLSYEKSFKSATAQQICAPVPKSTATKCQTGTIGDPPGQFSRIAFIEGRVLIRTNVLAVSPRLEYDLTGSKLGFRLPVYFAPDSKKALTGGVTFGYVTRGEGFGVSVFVGKAFSFY